MVILDESESPSGFKFYLRIVCLAIYWTLVRKKRYYIPGIKVMLKAKYPEQICLG